VIKVHAFSLKAFRGYPKSEAFDLGDGQSLLLFGRNGHGKSAISDAFEFLVNEYGTLERLGLKKGPTTSGRTPLRNVGLAADEPSVVSLRYSINCNSAHAVREVSESDTKIPTSLQAFADAAVVPFVIRGPELRKFVYDTPQRRYEELARFLNASRLIALQKDIRELQKQLGKDQRADALVRKDLCIKLASASGGTLKNWDESKVVGWINRVLTDVGLNYVTHPSFADAALSELKVREANERSTTALESAKATLNELLRVDGDDRPSVLSWSNEVRAARNDVAAAAAAAAESHLADIMNVAEQYLLDPKNCPDRCPVCDALYAASPFGSREGVLENIKLIRKRLGAFEDSKEALRRAEARLAERREQWWSSSSTLLGSCGIDEGRRESIRMALQAVLHDEIHFADLREMVISTIATLDSAMADKARDTQGQYVSLYQTIESTLKVGKQIAEVDHRSETRSRFEREVGKARTFIDSTVHGFFTATVKTISDRTVAFYKAVQRNSPIPIAVTVGMVAEDNDDNRGIELLINFEKLVGQKPQAYLSDSQQNTLALALRLAIIRHFNTELPFIVLDDVVTSFDAEMRKTTAEALVDQLAGIQLIVLTHDDPFWRALRDYTVPKQSNWKARRIARYDFATGPTFVDGKPDVQIVRDVIVSGQGIGPAVRGFWDAWLRNFARDVGARPLIPNPIDPFNYGANDLLNAIVKATSKYGLKQRMSTDAKISGIVALLRSNSFLNKATHQAEPIDGAPSDGDLASVFDDILAFTALFQCKCSNPRFSYDEAKDTVRCIRCDIVLVVTPT
jgi:recombinational DNA repair ATPase RecF